MKEITFEVFESEEDGYEARALGHSIFTQGEDLNELKEMVREAVLCHFEVAETPRVIRLHHIRGKVIALYRTTELCQKIGRSANPAT